LDQDQDGLYFLSTMLRKDLQAIYVHQWKSRRVDDIAVNHNFSTAEPSIIYSSGGANFNDPVRLRTVHIFGRLWLLLTSSNTLVLTAWSSKLETPQPRDIEALGLIDCDMHMYRPPGESFITCLMSMTPPITARMVRGTRRRGTVYGSPYQI
jgi:hypothetical protein